ncbi:GNAT family N-acetyltransferase [uncultured Comamonas sp.]|uniref:GNAT family N-acetyltransferase n=1 Tax=uncultured Comamonas sp. TaxID=114710 RepID=UPI0037488E87
MTSLPADPTPAPRPSLELRILPSMAEFDASAWDGLLAMQQRPTPFMRHAYLQALEVSGSATAESGWQPCHLSLWQGGALVGACPMYLKSHSYGEYVFDFAWARAYAEHGLDYFPKAVIAVPFTPVPGSRLLVADDSLRAPLLHAAAQFCGEQEISSLHLLFGAAPDLQAAQDIALMQRENVQFHWHNRDVLAGDARPYADFDDFLAGLQQDKRKKIRQERRKVQAAGVTFRHACGTQIREADWDFFYQCYERTYLEHGNAPYLTPAFFDAMRTQMPENWLLFIAEREGRPIAASLIAIDAPSTGPRHAYGRYWGAIERVDCLHFEACYYQPIEWCIRQGLQCFEGGAQGEHKMARALMPVRTPSAHWLAHAGFAQAVERYLARESQGMAEYQRALQDHSPLKHPQ